MVRKWEGVIGRHKSVVSCGCICLAFVVIAMFLFAAPGAAQQKGGEAKILKIGGLICLTGWFSSMDFRWAMSSIFCKI